MIGLLPLILVLISACISQDRPNYTLDGSTTPDTEVPGDLTAPDIDADQRDAPLPDTTTDVPVTDLVTPPEDIGGCKLACKNGGVCQTGGADSAEQCDCSGTGYSGALCGEPVCAMGCANGGVCIYPDRCDCDGTGYRGDSCEDAFCLQGCVNGSCDEPGKCNCLEGWSDPACRTPLCSGGCQNGGTCVRVNECYCEDDYVGDRCELLACGNSACPSLVGHDVSCSDWGHCEYRFSGTTPAWRRTVVWVWIPHGSSAQGTPQGELNLFPGVAETPVRTVRFAEGYFITKFEVTTLVHQACEADGVCNTPVVEAIQSAWGLNRNANGRSAHPQNGLTWAEARAVCTFLGGRLPSESEWEFATREDINFRQWPWGNTPEAVCATHAHFAPLGSSDGCGTGGTAEVGPDNRLAGVSPRGIFDLSGNVREWVEDCWHNNYLGAPVDGSAWTTDCAGTGRVLRGGSFYQGKDELRTSAREFGLTSYHDAFTGARCARSAK